MQDLSDRVTFDDAKDLMYLDGTHLPGWVLQALTQPVEQGYVRNVVMRSHSVEIVEHREQ